MDVTTDVSVMVMGLVVEVLAAYEAVQMPSFNDEDTDGEPHEGDGEWRGSAGEGAARPVGGDLLRSGQAAVESRLRRAGCGGPSQARVKADPMSRTPRLQSGRIMQVLLMARTSWIGASTTRVCMGTEQKVVELS